MKLAPFAVVADFEAGDDRRLDDRTFIAAGVANSELWILGEIGHRNLRDALLLIHGVSNDAAALWIAVLGGEDADFGIAVGVYVGDFGAQRVKNLSLFRAGWEAIKPKKLRLRQDKSKQVTSLIEEFNYPRFGPGMMWERCTERIEAAGSKGP